jgi:hypothetical protein
VVVGNWRSDDAERAVGSWLELVVPSALRPGLVACQNDAMAVGARSAPERVARQLIPANVVLPLVSYPGLAELGKPA